MDDFIKFFYTDGCHFAGRIKITNSEIIIYKKSICTVLFLGIIGDIFIRGKEHLRIQINNIANLKKDRYKRNKNACYMTLQSGETYIIFLNNPQETIDYLNYRIRIAAKDQIEQ